jgi:polyhydroxybutyrate depolymerase
MRLLLAALAVSTLAMAAEARACDPTVACTIADGDYFVHVPPGWDGHSALPVVMFFHGYGGSAEGVMADAGLGDALGGAGILLVAPQGLTENGANRSWSFPGKRFGGRDDFAFVGHVLDDVERRWPVDRSRVLAAGFSVGGSMVWSLACLTPGRFTAFAPVAGAFWRPEPTGCPGGPVSLRHVHGLADPMVPMQGRALRGGALHQGDVLAGMATWRRVDGCPEAPDRDEKRGALTCRTWSASACRSGRELVLCLHPGEHEIEPGWILDAFHWMESLPGRAKGSAASAPPPG